MKQMNRLKLPATRRGGLAATAAAVAAVVAGAAGVAAGPSNAAPAAEAATTVRPPTLRHGLLTVAGTPGDDAIALRLKAGDAGILQVDIGDDGSADFSFERADVARIAVNARAGADTVRIDQINGAFTDTIPTTINGGAGNDSLAGGSGAETLRGGAGNDSIDGNGGSDLALLGDGADTFIWDPGDGSDTIEGQDGQDTMLFNGSDTSEHIDLSANGPRLRFFRDAGQITMDTNGVEKVDFNAFGGADVVTVNDLSGTSVSSVNVDLASTLGGGDGQPDRVIANATDGNDAIDVNGDGAGVTVSGLAATIGVTHSEAANDRLEITTPAGSDSVDSAGLAAGVIQLLVNGVLTP
jgi:Ca2+-binding RTX toxin-like protein